MKVAELFEDEELAKEEKSVEDHALEQDFEKKSKRMEFSGSRIMVDVYSKVETYGGVNVALQYLVNRKTDAWTFSIAQEDGEDFTEIKTGEDSTSMIKHLKKKKKVTPHQIAEYL